VEQPGELAGREERLVRAAAERAIASLRAVSLGDPAYDAAGTAGPPEGGATAVGNELATLRGQANQAREAAALAVRWAALGAFVAVYDPPAEEAPRAPGPLAGLPVAIKDVFDVAGQQVRSGTPGLGHRTAHEDSAVWARMRAAGAVLVGRTRLPELGWAVRTPGCQNPWARGVDTGGSSGGSAAAVAAGIVPVALGTDTGGSVRIPAALCGVAGLRPTAGSVPARGITAFAPSLDTAGPIAATAAGCLLVHRVLSAPGKAVPEPGLVSADPAGLKVGWPGGLWQGRVTADVAAATEAAAQALRDAGVHVVDVDLPGIVQYARTAAYVIILTESAALWQAELAAQPDGASARLAALLRAGAAVAASGYLRAQRVARAIRREVAGQLAGQRLDALLLPTVPVTAAGVSAETVEIAGREVPVDSAYVSLTGLASVTGLPALSVPSGLDAAGLPVGAQLIGPAHAEAGLCLLGGVIEQSPGGRAVAAARAQLGAGRDR
jgi:Asp-tRNA(Asn)/Glu-tRNA(Gln) amidotransferase A subunit family amidase